MIKWLVRIALGYVVARIAAEYTGKAQTPEKPRPKRTKAKAKR
jgi:hypothetical protein